MSASNEGAAPPTPIQLRLCITEASRIETMVQRVVNSHYRDCPRRHGGGAGECGDGLCRYFTWHLSHFTAHRQSEYYIPRNCPHCTLFETWIESHSTHYCRSSCGLSLCSEIKKRSVKSRFHPCVEGFDEYLKSPSSSLNRNGGHVPFNPTASLDEVTTQMSPNDANDGYCSGTSGTTSSNTSPSCTQCFEPSRDPEATLPITSHSRVVQVLNREPSESSIHPNDLAMFQRYESNSITHQQLLNSAVRKGLFQRGSCGSVSQEESEDERRGILYGSRNSSLDHSLPHMTPQPTSTPYDDASWQDHSNSPRSQSSRQTLSHMKKHQENSDSAISSTSENEDLSSMESETTEYTPAPTLESASTPSTVHAHSFDNSGGSCNHVEPPEPKAVDISHYDIAEQCQLTDQLLEQYSDDIKMMNNRGRPIIVDHPPPPSMVESHALAHVDQDWRESYAAPSQRRGLNPSPPLTTSFADDSETIEEILDHRASVREYLQGQFYLQQTYSEHLHWTRVRQIGHGGQARCYCIEDNVNKYPLCLKEETESKKALDEAFICLKLARLVNDAPPNIVEFFGASILPHFSGKHSLQLFLELMPGCLQGHVFENGPLSSEAVLNYSYQLFEALDYLHQTLKVIHCDIKPANLLIDYNCQRLKVADFGCAELLEECCHGKGCTGNKDAGTLWYNPPQYYCTGNCSFGMDIWQAGCSVLFMVTGRRPWRHLCMDVDKSSPLVTTTTAALRKKRYCKLIGDQRGVYPLPGFLTSGVQQLLTGCLQFPPRLSAKDCVYLSAVSEATSPQQESRIVKELGYSPAHDVLDRLHSSACTPPVVDVYLGKDRFNTDVEGVPHVILSGWLGSVPYQNGMTYGDLLHSTRQHLPVTQYFEDCCLATSDNDPQTIWKTVTIGNARPYRVRNDQLVDPARAFILYPIERTCV